MESLLTSVLTKLQNVQITNQHCTDESVCTGNHSLTNTDKVMLISHIVVHKKYVICQPTYKNHHTDTNVQHLTTTLQD